MFTRWTSSPTLPLAAPLQVSPAELEIISMNPQPPASLIVVGRSGTGKTTCAVFRMFSRWYAGWKQGEQLNMVFITASGTLQLQVRALACALAAFSNVCVRCERSSAPGIAGCTLKLSASANLSTWQGAERCVSHRFPAAGGPLLCQAAQRGAAARAGR